MHNTLNAAIITSTSKSISTLRATCVAAALTVMAVASASAAPTLVNGSLTGPITYASPPSGWTRTPTDASTPDTMNQTANSGQPGMQFLATPSASPDGGTWVGLASARISGANDVEGITQKVSGFTIGNTYSLSWYHANFGWKHPSLPNDPFVANDPNGIEVFSDGAVVGTGSILAIGTNWVEESITFVATDTELDLTFQALGMPNDGDFSYQSIDGIRLAEVIVTPPTNAVPEPAALSLFSGAGLAMLLAGRRRKQAKQAA